MLVFWGEGKTGVPGEKLNPHMGSMLGFEPGPHYGGQALSPLHHPLLPSAPLLWSVYIGTGNAPCGPSLCDTIETSKVYGKKREFCNWSFSKTVETVLIGRTIPWMFPNLHDISVNVRLTSCYHLVCDFDKERSHSFWGVVVLRNTVDHSDGVHQTWNMLHHFSLIDTSKTVVIQSRCQRDALWNTFTKHPNETEHKHDIL